MSTRARLAVNAAVVMVLLFVAALTVTATLRYGFGWSTWWAAAPGGFTCGIAWREVIRVVVREWREIH